MSSTNAKHGDAMRAMPSNFVTVQIDTKNTEYLTSWLQKIILEQHFLSKVLFPSF